MKNIGLYALLCTGLLLASSCSQQGAHVRVYNYGENKQTTGGGSLGLHTYRAGETLWSIANAYQVDLRNLLDANGLAAPYRIHAGDRILIPAPNVYKIQNGDTLYKVSRMFDETTTDIARLNNMRPPYKLAVNQTLKIPAHHSLSGRLIKSAPIGLYEAKAKPVQITRLATPPTQTTAYKTPDNTIQTEALAPPQYITKQVPTAAEPPSAIAGASVNKANQQIDVATASPKIEPEKTVIDTSPLTLSSKGFMKPVPGKIISAYGKTGDGLHNDGINIKATRGDAVRSAEQGIVVYSGSQIEGYGNMLLIRHANGFMTAYAHMDKILVKKGERVKKGQSIGTVGTTGHVNTPQLHFEIRKGREAVNPSLYLKA